MRIGSFPEARNWSIKGSNKQKGFIVTCEIVRSTSLPAFFPQDRPLELYINIYLQKQLPDSQKQAVIRLLYKKGDPNHLKNWRPISLLNIDYKILSKILANRLRNEMLKIIGADQYCGIPNRSIHNAHDILHNIWEIELKKRQNKLMYLLIDQQKAFDRLDHSYLLKILKANNLPRKFINWVELMYKNVTSKVEVNGAYTASIEIKRSVRQGCPLSMLLFILASEGLLSKIKSNKSSKGYPINRKHHKKVVAYADDITLIITSEEEIQTHLQDIDKYCKASGAKINKDKTEAIILGSWNTRTMKEAMSWLKKNVKILGITYSSKDMNRLNFEPELEKLTRKIEIWGRRSHNILGRSHLLNIYTQPRLTYKLRHLDMPQDLKQKYHKMIYNFIWEGKTQMIAQTKLSMPKYLGGTGLIDLEVRQKAIWLNQLRELTDSPNEDYNKLIRSTIGPNRKLKKILEDKNDIVEEISYSELQHKPKIKYLRNYIQRNSLPEGKTKDIYQKLKEIENNESEEKLSYFRQLLLEKNPKLYQYGLLTGHDAHKTRSWLHKKKFKIPDIVQSQGKCDSCKLIEDINHILHECRDTEELRKYIQTKHGINNLMSLTKNKETNTDILIYQKTVITYKIHKNKGKRHTTTPIEQFESLKNLIAIQQ